MSDERPFDGDDPPWWELKGHARHAACLIAARSGDREALKVLIGDLTPLVWHVTRSYVLDSAAAEDVVQSVWLTLLRNLNSVAEPRALAQWLITTTRREAARVRKVNTRTEPVDDDVLVQFPTDNGLPEPEALRHDRDRQLWAAFRRLSARCQDVIRLTVLAGRAEYGAVAEVLRIPRGSIGPTRGRCLGRLRDMMISEGGSP
ncbi:MAG TPA: sigma-70 family RNA polymerase sigma factor [Pseudonocardiaceae bacterium]|jgi:RNA polymerase sigma factor (sigma-70 family)|nr:sigma-70 family RNA polymerase sigma factor [Pseudonocardiaceae bacterium]